MTGKFVIRDRNIVYCYIGQRKTIGPEIRRDGKHQFVEALSRVIWVHDRFIYRNDVEVVIHCGV